jgi:glycosyltransferase involved in cell wall biosynthesis
MNSVSKQVYVLEVSKSAGGVGSYTRRLVQALDKKRFKVTVACLSNGAEQMAADLSQILGVNAFSFPMAEYHIDPFSDIRVFFKLARLIRHERFDVIHAHTSKPGFLARLAAFGTGIPVIYRPANFSFDDSVPKIRAFLYSLLERFAARFLTSRIITVSKGERDLARRYHVGTDSQFVMISTGIDLRQFNQPVDVGLKRSSLGIPVDVPLIGTVSRITKDKGPFDFVEAAALVHAQFPNAHFLWVGDGPLDKRIKARASFHKLDEVFHFVGLRYDVPEILKIIDCFVLSSHSEALSIAMLEAMASSLPVVTTMVPGADEAIQDGRTGFLVPIGGIKELAGAIAQLLKDPVLSQKIGEAARDCIEKKFSLINMVAATEQLYLSVLEEKRRKR